MIGTQNLPQTSPGDQKGVNFLEHSMMMSLYAFVVPLFFCCHRWMSPVKVLFAVSLTGGEKKYI